MDNAPITKNVLNASEVRPWKQLKRESRAMNGIPQWKACKRNTRGYISDNVRRYSKA